MPLSSGQTAPQTPDITQSLAGFGVGMQETGPAQTQQPLMTPTGQGSVQGTLPQGQLQNPGPQPYMSPQGNPYPLGTEESRQWAAQQAWGNRTGFTRSFATQVLDQFGDMLHKADPHVAGLLAFRVYMDKIMR
jgi:hypothetical protein